MRNYNTPKEANAKGGSKSTKILYRCPMCNYMGEGQQFVNRHLTDGCKGPGRKTQKAQPKYVGREKEAEVNTAIWNAKRMIKEETAATKMMVNRIKQDIQRMKDMGSYDKSIF